MRIPFHAVRYTPLMHTSKELAHALKEPILYVEPLYDAIDVPYSYDIVLTNGFYLCVLSFCIYECMLLFRNR